MKARIQTKITASSFRKRVMIPSWLPLFSCGKKKKLREGEPFFYHMSSRVSWLTKPFGHSLHGPTPYLCSRERESPKKD